MVRPFIPAMGSFTDNAVTRNALRRLRSDLCGRYRLERLIGIGGMAAVYAGVHRNGHAVAVKILHETHASDPDIQRLFRREAQLVNKIEHAGVVPVIDDDITEDGRVFLVMPLLRGETVRSRAERMGGKLSVEEVVVIGHAVLEALAAAHAQKIVHRDIKPENIFLTTEGEVKVLDFGIGRFFEAAEGGTATRTGRALGTPAFMAPEQALGRTREVDGRTDVWALGATMYTLLSGRFVHDAETPTEVAILAATRPAPLLVSVAPDVPIAIRNVVDHALSFRREDRWQEASTMAPSLQTAFETTFGRAFAEAPRLEAPAQDSQSAIDLLPTQAPSGTPPSGSQDASAPREQAPGTGSTEIDRGAVTRTTADEKRLLRAPKRLDLRFQLLVLGVVLSTLGAFAFGTWKTRPRDAKTGAQQEDARGEAVAVRAGVEAWHDGRDAIADFSRALSANANMAPALLMAPMTHTWPGPEDYAHFSRALALRAELEPDDQALLDAYEPSMRVPADFEEARRRLEQQASHHPGDFRFRQALSNTLMKLGDADSMIRIATEATATDPTCGAAWITLAIGYDLQNDASRSRESLETCLRQSRLPTRCMNLLAHLEMNEGRCEAVEELAQNMLAAGDRSAATFSTLAEGVYGSTHDLGKLDAVLARAGTSARPAPSAADISEQQVGLSILKGDTRAALSAAENLTREVSQADDAYSHQAAMMYTLLLERELGDDASAKRDAISSSTELSALASDPQIDISIYLDAYLRDLHVISDPEFYGRRTKWLDKQAHKVTPGYGRFAFLWIPAYGQPAHDRVAASEAVAEMNDYLPMTDPLNRPEETDEVIGRVYFLTDKFDQAIPFLARAARSCTWLRRPITHLWALYELAKSYQAQGHEDLACNALAELRRDAKLDPQSQTGRRARQLYDATHCHD